MPIQHIAQNTSLVFLRLLLFSACNKYLSRSLYPDLTNLSLEGPPGHASSEPEPSIELGPLPSPATTPLHRTTQHIPSSQKALHYAVSRILFSLSLTESCIMFLLLIFQAMDLLSPRTRLHHWRYSLMFLMVSILILVPLSVSMLLMVGLQTSQGPGNRRLLGFRIGISFVPVATFLFALLQIPLPDGFVPLDMSMNVLSRLLILGTITLGLLSGFGAISNSWGFIPFLSSAKPTPTEHQITTAEYSLASIRNDLRERRATAEQQDIQGSESWLSRVGATFRPNSEYMQEIRGLEALEYQMARNLESMREFRNAAKFSVTFRGRLYRVFGRLFAVYCIIRTINSLANIILPTRRQASISTTYPDIISELIVYILSLFYTRQDIQIEDIMRISRQLSLVFVGIIILTSIRLVLRGVTRALRVTSRRLGASLMLLILAQLMGIYLLSTLVQMRASFPPPPKLPDGNDNTEAINLFSTIPAYEVFGSLFDWSFLLAAGVSAFVRWGAQKMNEAGEV
ncbi:hypothetical protein AMATHDRAFT_61214 [Amanita thiersii Skay4041]|uniref:Abscisic acid G-protein coupled receptor-like domain-containing protein n=1 Tax=Amanita thiersii Skay4041 TaxID=703135 RepID=A0A2A9NJY5_9AGAR|nr:hypothetical protein AMATHDRAFT_61214 [Amanita thiersii Skay4041]